jgi:hypothetical protein
VPNCEAYTIVEQRGDRDMMISALGEIWHFIATPDQSRSRIAELSKDIPQIIPTMNSDTTSSWLTAMAVDAGVAMLDTLIACLTDDIDAIMTAPMSAINSVDDYLTTVNNPDPWSISDRVELAAFVRNCPMMTTELSRQDAVISKLESVTQLRFDILQDIRSQSGRFGVQPIRRGLVARQ